MNGPAGRAFQDTNVLIYAFDPGESLKREHARDIVDRAVNTHDALISFQVVQEFLSVALRRFTKPMRREEGLFYLENVLIPLWEIFPTASLYSEALSIAAETGWTFYDSLIVSAAIAGGCTSVFTEDLQHGRTIRGVEIRNPFV